jgi:uncharacterized circularly permuted ATP-grasp superfamily protein
LCRITTIAAGDSLSVQPTDQPSSRPATSENLTTGKLFDGYQVEAFYDEMFDAAGQPRPECAALLKSFQRLSPDELRYRQQTADRSMLQLGITFNVYTNEQGRERIFPFDVVPRIVSSQEWAWVENGLRQRIVALNYFLSDIYGEQRILRDATIPSEVVQTAKSFRPQCVGLKPPKGIWCHITGTDLIRDEHGQMHVLEDNLRCPSGVSYVLQNRQLMKQAFPKLFHSASVRPVDDYPSRLLETLQYIVSDQTDHPKVALLSPGSHNSAYFEHSFLAQQMGIDLVEGRDLEVCDGVVYVRTTKGFERVDVLYRRIDDDFIDPQSFRADSMLGVAGLMEAYRKGSLGLANAPGTGVADDKMVYAYVPEMIRYYLDEDPIIPNVPTFVCLDDTQRQHVLQNLAQLVVKPVNESGGYGLVIGPEASQAELSEVAERIKANPRNYIAQPTIRLSRAPTIVEEGVAGRHVDLRPFIVYGRDVYVLPGGLTRVALTKGSLVVNSSQGGGSKDTWVVP